MKPLEAGPELNARVAKALGWKPTIEDDEGEPYPTLWDRSATCPERPSYIGDPPFSTYFAWAWSHVRTWATREGIVVRIEAGYHWAQAVLSSPRIPYCEGLSTDDALALCEAVLKAREALDMYGSGVYTPDGHNLYLR